MLELTFCMSFCDRKEGSLHSVQEACYLLYDVLYFVQTGDKNQYFTFVKHLLFVSAYCKNMNSELRRSSAIIIPSLLMGKLRQ